MYPKRQLKKCLASCSCATIIVALGVLIVCLKSVFYKFIIGKVFLLQPDSYSYHLWKKNPVPVSLKLYLFNWTNSGEIFNSSIKPAFQELGPYEFDETKEKINITWNSNNNTVSFYHLKKWWFNQERSNGSLDDPVVSVNPIGLTSSLTVRNWNYFLKQSVNILFRTTQTKLSEAHKVGDVLFRGYNDTLLTMVNNLPFSPGSIPKNYDKFAWFYMRNGSETFEGQFNMDVGLSGQLGELYQWKFENRTAYFPGECGKISGSAGEFFPGHLTKESRIRLFSPDLCRYVELEFEKESEVKGLSGYKYSAADRFLDNGTKIPENKCFCTGECLPYGTVNISACRYGSPAFVSLPHFFRADSYYTESIEGMSPNESKHGFFIVFEPKTGMPLEVSARLQLNLLVEPVPGISLLRDVPKIVIPVLWFEQSVLIPDDMAFYVQLLLHFETICLICGIVCILCGVMIDMCVCYKTCQSKVIERNEDKHIKEEIPLTGKKHLDY
ncbi:hypothetical protein ABEB36_004958 [Hypothenemus hampei]|uniref:Uncharacterized protein n=1 Tax=Hypothenemus hampei TaxID=57062 RepID=A0ABD1EWF3_HYPHA